MCQNDRRTILDSAPVSWRIVTVLPASPPGLWQPVLLSLVTVCSISMVVKPLVLHLPLTLPLKPPCVPALACTHTS